MATADHIKSHPPKSRSEPIGARMATADHIKFDPNPSNIATEREKSDSNTPQKSGKNAVSLEQRAEKK
jgi:hypothetical protein